MFLSEWREFPSTPCRGGDLDDSSRLDVVEIARVPDMLRILFPFWSGYGLISTPVEQFTNKINCVVASCWTFIDIEMRCKVA